MAMTDHLPLKSVIGFAGKVGGGLVLHPNGKTMAYPLGATVVVKELGDTYSQSFLQGHSDEVSCLAISRDGAFLASGQITNMGLSADIVVWDLHARTIVHRMSLHKVKVAELSFSHDGRYLASLGGQDDNSLVIWDVETGNAICGTPTPGLTRCVRFLNTSSKQLVTGGGNTLVVWDFDLANRKLRPSPCRLGNIRRDTNYITVDERVRLTRSLAPLAPARRRSSRWEIPIGRPNAGFGNVTRLKRGVFSHPSSFFALRAPERPHSSRV